ncbi:MAG: diacylglycerol/lipid kinase family protein, partial [Alphaproteobacteria bacterium]
KRRLGRLGYALFALHVLARRRPRLHDVEVDGETLRVAAAIVANARHYGGPYRLAPEAGLDRPGLQVVLMRAPGRLAHLRAAAALATRRMQSLGGVEIRAARRVVVGGDDGAPVQLDGDPGGQAPVRIEWLPDALTLLAP